MAGQEFTLQAQVEIDGSPLAPDLVPSLERVVVDDHLHLPDTFVLAFRDLDRKVLSRARIKIGSQVKVAGTPLGGKLPEPLLSGEVTAIEAEYDALGARAIVRGYDHSHRLHRGRRTETYRNVKDSDIAAQIARRAGVQVGTVDDSRTTHEHVSQANVSDWEFLRARAREIGFEVLVADGKLHFRRPVASAEAPSGGDFSSKDPLQLVFGQDLLEFRPRITSSEQVKEVRVRGWDPIKKQAVVGSAAAGTTSAKLSSNPGALASMFGSPSTLPSTDRSRHRVRSTLPPPRSPSRSEAPSPRRTDWPAATRSSRPVPPSACRSSPRTSPAATRLRTRDTCSTTRGIGRSSSSVAARNVRSSA